MQPGLAQSRAPLSGAAQSRAPLSGAAQSRAPLSGAAQSRAPLSGAAQSRAPLSGAAQSRGPLSGAAQGRGPLSGAAQGRTTLRGAPGPALRLALLLLALLVTLCSGQNHESAAENSTASTESPETVSSHLDIVSPRNSWLVFRRNSNKGENKKTKPPKRASKHGLPGPPGPPGPQGPPGPPAPLLPQQEQLVQELQLRLREMAGAQCLVCESSARVATAFHARLRPPLPIPRRSLLELQPFSSPSDGEQSLQRGQGFNASDGRYTAPVSGFYQLTASLLIEPNERSHARMRDSVKASICIESLCQSNISLEAVTGVSATGGVFSILLTGTLYLQAGEYVSVFVDNGTGSALTVLQDSLFSGILLGV